MNGPVYVDHYNDDAKMISHRDREAGMAIGIPGQHRSFRE